MGVDLNMDNLTAGNIDLNNQLSAFDARNELLDNLLDDELYNQELYNGGNGSRYNGNGENLKDYFFGVVKTTTNFDMSTVDKLEHIDVSNISMSYNKTADMYRNQNAVDHYVEGKKHKFEARNEHLLQGVDNRIRQKEIYTYYYKKYNAQKKILLNIIVASLLVIGLTYLNKSYKFLFTDTLFILALGIIFAVLVINICIQLIEILFRNNTNYDEYDFLFNIKGGLGSGLGVDTNGTVLKHSDKEKERQKCDAEIKAYQGR